MTHFDWLVAGRAPLKGTGSGGGGILNLEPGEAKTGDWCWRTAGGPGAMGPPRTR